MIHFQNEDDACLWLMKHLRVEHKPASVIVDGWRMTGWLYEADSDPVSTGRCALVDYDDPKIDTFRKNACDV